MTVLSMKNTWGAQLSSFRDFRRIWSGCSVLSGTCSFTCLWLVLGDQGSEGIHSAREFVWWHNGHPDMCNLAPDLQSTDSAVVLGQGNVALDVARFLLCCTSELAATDIADYALDALRGSTIRTVYLVGQRDPVQAACTGLKNIHVFIKEADLVTSPADESLKS